MYGTNKILLEHRTMIHVMRLKIDYGFFRILAQVNEHVWEGFQLNRVLHSN